MVEEANGLEPDVESSSAAAAEAEEFRLQAAAVAVVRAELSKARAVNVVKRAALLYPLRGYQPPSLGVDSPAPTASLPPGWERGTNKAGEVFYVDHNTRTTHWEAPKMTPPTTDNPLRSPARLNPSEFAASQMKEAERLTEVIADYALGLLVKAGCSSKQVEKDYGDSPVHVAIYTGQTAALEFLIRAGCDVNRAANSNGRTPAQLAAQEGQTAALELLVQADCDVNQADNDGRTPAHLAAFEGHTAALKFLLEAPGCNVNQADKNGRTPADVAARNGTKAAARAAASKKKMVDDNRAERNKKNNAKKKEKKNKARLAAAIEEQVQSLSEALANLKLAPSSSVESERPLADDDNQTPATVEAGGYDKIESDDEEVELCRCIHCLELEREQGRGPGGDTIPRFFYL